MTDPDTTAGDAEHGGVENADARPRGDAGLGSQPRPRPTHVSIDPAVCARFGTCLAVAPAALAGAVPSGVADPGSGAPRGAQDEGVVATSAVLDAMSACPTGAIRWVEPGSSRADGLPADGDSA